MDTLANLHHIKGLTNEQVLESRRKNGDNQLVYKKENGVWGVIKRIAQDPMVVLLLVASVIYFINGKTGDGIFLASAIIFQSGISLFQYSRSHKALEKLKNFIQPKCKVIRNGEIVEVESHELVLGDSLVGEEGTSVPADAVIIHANDFSVNESVLTGESMAVEKNEHAENNQIFRGTAVASGLAIATITAIGNETKLGKIGTSLAAIEEEKTPLELQIGDFVKKMAILGGIIFLIVWAVNYYHTRQILNSLLQALTLAMSILPEEIPVAFTTFMALGAWRLMKTGIVVKQMKTVETLGSATVICTDKTGTLTENIMSLAKLFELESQKTFTLNDALTDTDKALIRLAMFASEPIAFDPMEIALHEAYSNAHITDERSQYKIIHEYPLGGKPPMMTHIFEDTKGNRVVAAKGAVEAIINVSSLTGIERKQISEAVKSFTSDGYRVLGIAEATSAGNDFPVKQEDFKFTFKGVVAFYDPPKKNIESVLQHFYKAGIQVKIITGDNAATTSAIAKQIGFRGYEKSITGNELMKLSDTELENMVLDTNIYTRMFPDAKLRVINALKAKNQVVAMTGDGVNDGPALKAAHIGIAMGKKGTEIAKEAASLILLKDDLSKMVKAIAMGRKIYANLKKSIQYIISIHIPIILTVFLPLALGWVYPNIFSPIHIIFLELIMGPTCSIIYENEPIEKNTMSQVPRPFSTTFFSWKELATSILQGLMITIGTLLTYQYAVSQGFSEAITRTMIFTVLISSNILLTLVNRSFYYSIITTLKYKNNLVALIISITIIISAMLLYIRPLTKFFEFEQLSLLQLGISMGVGFIFVIWYELVKWQKRS